MKLPWWLPFGKIPEVSPQELAEKLRGPRPPLLLDVRTAAEWNHGHIAGAVHVPIQNFREEFPRHAGDRDREVIAICLSAHRSIPAVRVLRSAGFGRAAQLQGGMRAWRAAGLPTVSG